MSKYILLQNLGIIRPQTDFQSGTLALSANVSFEAILPEVAGGRYGVSAMLNLVCEANIMLAGNDDPLVLFTAEKTITINSSTTAEPLVSTNIIEAAANGKPAAVNDGFGDGETAVPVAVTPHVNPLAGKTLWFGGGFFDKLVMSRPGVAKIQPQLVDQVYKLNLYLDYRRKLADLRKAPVEIGADGESTGDNAAAIVEVENILANRKEFFETMQSNVRRWVSSYSLPLTVDGFVMNERRKDKPDVTPGFFQPGSVLENIVLFAHEHNLSNASTINSEAAAFVRDMFKRMREDVGADE